MSYSRDLGARGAGGPRGQRSAEPPGRAAWETSNHSAGMRLWSSPYRRTSQHTPSSEGKGKVVVGDGGAHPPEIQTRHVAVARGNRAPNPLEAERKSSRASEPRFCIRQSDTRRLVPSAPNSFMGSNGLGQHPVLAARPKSGVLSLPDDTCDPTSPCPQAWSPWLCSRPSS